MSYGWYFNEELSPSDELVDRFADSKFGMDRWTSFTREIIQNSLDARDSNDEPVEVVFDLKKDLKITDIPGGNYIKTVLERCKDKASNNQTVRAYTRGLDILEKPFVYCLKVSDYNTKGVQTGRENAWGAFVFDEGRSIKQRPGSAGSHGVGKKVPFIISTCNTVFYATKNKYEHNGMEKSDVLSQGKTTLITWEDACGIRRSPKGWYGTINENSDPKNKISPITGSDLNSLNSFFVRRDRFGTDVIIVGVNAYKEEDKIKKKVINSILENFFVAIKEGNLKVKVFGETIEANEAGLMQAFEKWYEYSKKESGHTCLVDLLRVFSNSPEILPVRKDGNEIGQVHMYFDDSSESNSKYYTVIREHGMKIHEYRINSADRPFSAIALIKGKELNSLLSELENAAHDNFITRDDDMVLNPAAIEALELMRACVSSYLVEKTKINDGEDLEIEGLRDMLAIPGFTARITRNDTKARVIRNKSRKKGSAKGESENSASSTPAANPEPGSRPNRKKKVKFYNAFSYGPVLVKNNEGYLLRFKVDKDIDNCDLHIKSINSDEKFDDSIADLIISASDAKKKYKIVEGHIAKVKLLKDEMNEIQIRMSRDVRYRLTAELWSGEVKK